MNFLLRVSILFLSLFFTLFLSACFNQEDPPSTAPANASVVAGDGLAVIDWDLASGLNYWLFYKQGATASLSEYDRILTPVTPPYVLTGLSNGSQYAFAVTSSQNGSQVGPFSPALTTTPRLLGPSIDWLVGTALSTNDLHGIAFGRNTYVAVGDVATVFVAPYSYPSTGGVTGWSQASTLPAGLSANLTSVLFDGQRFMALGSDGTVIKTTDTTALIWDAATAITSASPLNAFAVGAGRYLAVGDAGVIYTNNRDGATAAWTQQTSGTSNNLYAVSYLNGRFIAVGDAGTVLTSLDGGVSWTTPSIAPTLKILRGVSYGASTYVAVGDSGAVVSSSDANTWAEQAAPTAESLRAITFGPDQQFIAVGTSGVLAYSLTGLDGSWDSTATAGTAALNAISPNLLFIATGAAGSNVSGK